MKTQILKIWVSVLGAVLSSAGGLQGQTIAANPYQEQLVIHNPGSTTLTDYQVKVVIDTATLVAQGKIQPDCDDIRFAGPGSLPLYYWLQSGCNTPQTVLWVKVQSIPPGDTTIYVSYGDLTASSGSDGEHTFLFFDDFNGTSLDMSKWSITYDRYGSGGSGPEITVAGGNLTMVGDAINSGEGIASAIRNDFRAPVAFSARARRSAGAEDVNAALYYGDTTGVVIVGIQNYGNYFGIGFPTQIYRDYSRADNEWHDYDAMVCNREALFTISGVVSKDRLSGSDITGTPAYFWLRTWGNATMMVDYVFVRKMDPEFEGFVSAGCVAQPPGQDLTPPVISHSVAGTAGLNGWYISDVTVSWNVSDPETGIVDSFGCGPVTLAANTPGTTLTCTAINGAGLSNSASVTVKIDKSPVAITNTLIAYINALSYVDAGTKNSLTTKLDNALASLARSNGNAAKNQLAAFINEIQAQRGKKLTASDADFLIQQAMNAQAAIV